jgi:hypothetical protein
VPETIAAHACVSAQELVGRGELGADPRGLAPRVVDRALGVGDALAGARGRSVEIAARGATERDLLQSLLD